MKKIKKRIKQRIKEKRGLFTRARRKKYLRLNRLGLYNQRIPMMPKIKKIVAKLTWYQRIYVFIILTFRRLWRKIKNIKD